MIHTDPKQVTKKIIDDSFSNQWLNNFNYLQRQETANNHIVAVVNKTEEHISAETFVKDLEKSLINSCKAMFVVSRKQCAEIRTERDDQAR